ncbi:glycosyltransferase family 2 protein [Stappia sp. ES.058]|uniref:glycosyltransferase family 2 protein n=1 Tax=Stappia sp. ES.058 TaxID=1881061 RepID=UPI00087AE88D|nr:glycosyltransferase family 2 protein [Stappia sp. ES.058]SDT97319.1 Glycosyl transferase family 2 [Stappia sp. ES.058]
MLLSVVVPFYNSHAKSRRIMATLRSLKADDVEVMLIDDGGNLEEAELLKVDEESLSIARQLVRQRNAGPGGARNRGLSWCQGKYVWFVDSDDDFSPDAIAEVRALADKDYDFIDFVLSNKHGHDSTMGFPPGEFEMVRRGLLISKFGRLCTKVFRRDFLIENRVFYPENCIFEDNALCLFMPLLVKRFYRSETIGYHHHVDASSVTRGSALSPRYFDRLDTAEYGLARSFALGAISETERAGILSKFSGYFLRVTLVGVRGRGGDALMVQKVMKAYRDIMRDHDMAVAEDQFEILLKTVHDVDERRIYRLLWDAADEMSDPKPYFARFRDASWRRPINFRETPMAAKKPAPAP